MALSVSPEQRRAARLRLDTQTELLHHIANWRDDLLDRMEHGFDPLTIRAEVQAFVRTCRALRETDTKWNCIPFNKRPSRKLKLTSDRS